MAHELEQFCDNCGQPLKETEEDSGLCYYCQTAEEAELRNGRKGKDKKPSKPLNGYEWR